MSEPKSPNSDESRQVGKRSVTNVEVAGKHNGETEVKVEDIDHSTSTTKRLCKDALSEFFGVFILVLFGNGVVAQVVLSKGTAGDYQSINWGWGIGVMLGVYTASKSGAHINPAVTFANCLHRGFPWHKFPVYALAQTLGGTAASLVVYANYRAAIDLFEGGAGVRTVGLATSTAGLFCTYPQPFMTRGGMFLSELVASAVLMFAVFAVVDAGRAADKNNQNNHHHMVPLGLFFVVFGIGVCFGWETGYAINFARDFGPRLASFMLGYGGEVWSAGGFYFWIPAVAPLIGCTLGGLLYDAFIYEGDDSAVHVVYKLLATMSHSSTSGQNKAGGTQADDNV